MSMRFVGLAVQINWDRAALTSAPPSTIKLGPDGIMSVSASCSIGGGTWVGDDVATHWTPVPHHYRGEECPPGHRMPRIPTSDYLLNTQSRDRPRDDQLLDLFGAFEDVEDPPQQSSQ